MEATTEPNSLPFKAARRALSLTFETALVAAVYFAIAKASLAFASINPSATPVWPPTGFALALVLLRGRHLAPAILLGAFLTNIATTGDISSSSIIAVGNMVEALVGAWLLDRWAGGASAFQTPLGIAKFALVAGLIATPLSATVGVSGLLATGRVAAGAFGPVWFTWWLGDLAGAVMVTPVLVLWAEDHRAWRLDAKGYETLALVLFALAVGLVAFSPVCPAPLLTAPLSFLAVLPLMWAALRFEPKITAAVAVILSAAAVWGVAANVGPFIQPTLNDSFLLLIAFIVSVSLPSLALSASMAARYRSLLESTESYRMLIDSVRDYAICRLDPSGRVVSWNKAAERTKGYLADEIIGRHFGCFFTAQDQERGEPERSLRIAAKEGSYETEAQRVRCDGSEFPARIVINAIRDSQGTLVGFAKISRDISLEREAQTALDQTRQQLLQSQKLEALGQLTGGIAHDFNNLLMAVAAGVNLLERDLAPERKAAIAQAIRQSVDRGARLTRRLLSFARAEPLKLEPIDVKHRLGAMRALLEPSLREDIRIEFDFPDGLWPILADPAELELAVLNLAVNARDAMPQGGVLTISAANFANTKSDPPQGVRITVADTGSGMTAEVRERAFDPFYSTKGPGQGTGLGLSMVYGFAKQCGGSVAIDSAIGAGTRIIMLLPRADAMPEGRSG